jgi:hypothetical protein
MISIEAQQKLLLNISRRLKMPITAYAIGGTAMMFMGFKDFTLDIDLVFESEKDREIFSRAVQEIGYQKMDSVLVYGPKQNQPQMFTLGEERLDLFVVHVIDFDFSKTMIERAKQVHQYGNNFILKVADPHDLILMKCATDRKRDLDDAKNIINSIKIDWNILIDEAKMQIKLGKHTAAFNLGEFLEKLKYKMGVNIPKSVIDDLFKVVERQAEAKRKQIS